MGLFSSQNSRKTSSQEAMDRMKLVLVHDRADISMETMEKMKNDIIDVISRYVNIDPNEVVINLDHEGQGQKLVADIPFKRSARPRR